MDLNEAKQMLKDGDIQQVDLDDHKKSFKNFYGRETSLPDDEYLLCIANFDDDYRGDDAAKLIKEAEVRRNLGG